MTFLEFLLELMMILIFLTGDCVLDGGYDGVHMVWGTYVKKFIKSFEFEGIKKMDDIAGSLEDAGHSWPRIVSLIMIEI